MKRQGEALVVVLGFPGPETEGSGGEIGESLAAPELLVVNPMTALHLAGVLRAPRGGGVPIHVEIRSGSSGPPCRYPVETDNNRGPVSFRLLNIHSRIALAWSKYM
jgi:hypothetical protein